MHFEILPKLDPGEMTLFNSILLDDNRRMYPLNSYFYRTYMTPAALRVWCHDHARYNVITGELLDWLREQIGTRTALEIAAGMGDLGYRLGIPMTDSHVQADDPSVKAVMKACGQVGTTPPPDVLKMDAQTAVKKFKPQVVIGAWVTQRWLPGDEEGSIVGPREEEIIKNCETYIHIGNEIVHRNKRILKLPHQTFKFPWLVSRAKEQDKNIIQIWTK